MSVPQFQHAVVVLGMHRSGTSALAGMLGLAGLAMPRTLLAPSSGNERGLWESESVKSFNEDLLRDLATTWHGVEDISFSSLGRRKIGQVRKLRWQPSLCRAVRLCCEIRCACRKRRIGLGHIFISVISPYGKVARLCKGWP